MSANSRSLPGPWKLTGSLCPQASPFAPLLFAGRLQEGLETLGALGYDAVELSLRDPAEIDEARLLETLARQGLAVSTVATGRMYYEDGLSLAAVDPEARKACLERLKDEAKLAARLNSTLLIGGCRGVLPRDSSARALRAEAAGVFKAAAEFAASLGVTVLSEPINHYETNFINTVDDALAFHEEAGSPPNVLLLVDTYHMNLEEVSFEGAIRKAGSNLGYIHLSDSNRRAPGEGHTNFGPVLGALEEVGFNGYIGMEILPWPDDYNAARLGLENTRKLVAGHFPPRAAAPMR